jgi:AcrR family transcriptional regulator
MNVNSQNQCETAPRGVQERLLDAAEELFCEKGYEATSVRELAAAADCNVASVNYYFGGKDKLYVEVWRHYLAPIREARIKSIEVVMGRSGGSPDLEELLNAFAAGITGPLADMHKSGCFVKLMGREMLDQHLPGNLFFEELVKPTMSSLGGALMKACPTLDQSKAPLLVLSFIGQLMHTMHFRGMMQDVTGEELLEFELPEVVDHIVKFSAAGIRAYCRETVE